MNKHENQEGADMTRSVIALVAAVGCFGAEPHRDELTGVRRVFVDHLRGENAEAVRDMIVNALQNTRLLRVTEDIEKADAVLKGSASDEVFTETHQYSEGVHGGAAIGAGTGTARTGLPRLSATVGEQESGRSTERRHEAAAAVRLVTKDGDVIWSTTQESTGAKFRGAAADVAERVVRQLMVDLERARRPLSTPPNSSGMKQ
jgi:hypothetical protein